MAQSGLIWQLLPSEEEDTHLVLAQGKSQLAHHDEDHNERPEPNLDRPKRRMGELPYRVCVGFCHTHAGDDKPDHGIEVSVHEGHDQVDRGLPQDVEYERFTAKRIDTWDQVDKKQVLCNDESSNGRPGKGGDLDVGSRDHQLVGQRDETKGSGEEDRRPDILTEFLLEPFKETAHLCLPSRPFTPALVA